jgi:hypothetical protein
MPARSLFASDVCELELWSILADGPAKIFSLLAIRRRLEGSWHWQPRTKSFRHPLQLLYASNLTRSSSLVDFCVWTSQPPADEQQTDTADTEEQPVV